MKNKIKFFWEIIIQFSETYAYQRYVEHFHQTHVNAQEKIVSRKEFYKKRVEEKWQKINRCC